MIDRDPSRNDLPPYTYIPGGPWPHPISDPSGHSSDHRPEPVAPIVEDDWRASLPYRRGIALFNAGYYWEAHEAWESLWHAHGRRGPVADLLKALIKLAAAGVKVREGQAHGVATHAGRALGLIEAVRGEVGDRLLGLDLARLAGFARDVRKCETIDPGGIGAAVSIVFADAIEPD